MDDLSPDVIGDFSYMLYNLFMYKSPKPQSCARCGKPMDKYRVKYKPTAKCIKCTLKTNAEKITAKRQLIHKDIKDI